MKKVMHSLAVALVAVAFCGSVVFGAEPWKFIFTGDSRGQDNGINRTILTELAAEAVRADVDLFVMSGDLVSGGYSVDVGSQLNTWLSVMQPVYDAQIAVYVIRGNHEDYPFLRDVAVWHNTFSGEYAMPGNGPAGEVNLTYSFEHKNALFVGLDEYVNDFEVNQEWLNAQLAANTKPHVFVYGHLPAYQALPRECLDFFPAKRDAFRQSLYYAGARTYLCSHDHFYDHARIDDGDGNADDDLHQYIVGTAGAPPYHDEIRYGGANGAMTPVNIVRREDYGYLLVEVDGSEVTMTFMRRDTTDVNVSGTYEADDTWSYSLGGITLVAPNGGEKIVAPQDYTIGWQTSDTSQVQQVRLYFYDGQMWRAINDEPVAADAGFYVWSAAGGGDFEECLIRVSDWDNPSISDMSDGYFSVFECRLETAADINKDCYVDLEDLAILAAEWLECGNPFDAACGAE